jgi:hypothetical protein
VDIANAPLIGTGWRHHTPKSVSEKEEFLSLFANLCASDLVVADEGVFPTRQQQTLSLLDHAQGYSAALRVLARRAAAISQTRPQARRGHISPGLPPST